MMKSDSTSSTTATGTATHTVATATNQLITTQPSTPPAAARATMPSDALGCPPNTWQSDAMDTSIRPRPMPIRVLSCTDAGCRNSHPAKTIMMTGSATASRPKSPPNV